MSGSLIGLIVSSYFMFILFVFFFGVFSFVFWIWMLIDCLNRDFEGEYTKLVWVLLMIFSGWVGSILYFFLVKYTKKPLKVGNLKKSSYSKKKVKKISSTKKGSLKKKTVKKVVRKKK